MDLIKKVEALIADAETKYADYKSPAEFDSAVASAVDAKYEGWISPEQVEAKIGEAVTASQNEFESRLATYVKRESKLSEANLDVTDERKTKLREFEVSAEGDREFDTWVTSLTSGQKAIEDKLKEGKVEINDDVQKTVASLDGVDDPRFATAYAMLQASKVISVDLPGSGSGGEDTNNNKIYH